MRILFTMLFALPLCAQAPAVPPPGQGAPHTFKNLQLLKPEEVHEAMNSFRVGLGVECTFCHVKGDFSSDEKHNKFVARKMIELVRSINPKFPDGKDHVSCYTCHRGAEEPLMAPPAKATEPAAPEHR
jgi:photosynthetic reaction center cytochrome c subunit